MASPDKGRRRAKTDRSKTDSAQASKSEAEEVAELQELIGRSPAKHYGSTMSGASSVANRPRWDARPLHNPPGALRGLKPVTKEPWAEVQSADMAARMEFGSRADLGLADVEEMDWKKNGFVQRAKERRQENDRHQAWDSSIVRHSPPVLRGQKILRRAEPWSSFQDDSIEELNAVEGTSVNDIYNITADRFVKPKKPTIEQPSWDSSQRLGIRRPKPGGDRNSKVLAQSYREQRKPQMPTHGMRSPEKKAALNSALQASTALMASIVQ